MTKKSEKICDECGGKNFKSHPTTWPLDMGEKKLSIAKVWVRECLACNSMEPTEKGKEKIARGMMAFMDLMLR